MTYYDTIYEDLKRAREILARGKADQSIPPPLHPETPCLCEIPGSGTMKLCPRCHPAGTIFGADTYAAYKLIESFVQYIERLRHALNNCEIHADVQGISERTACAVCFTDAVRELERRDRMLKHEGIEHSECQEALIKAQARAADYRKVMLQIADCIDAAALPNNHEPENIFERAKRLREDRDFWDRKAGEEHAKVIELERQAAVLRTLIPLPDTMVPEGELVEVQNALGEALARIDQLEAAMNPHEDDK